MNTLNHLGNNIAKFRKSSDVTQEQLAEQLNVSVSAVSQWETGKTLPDISAIPVLCHVFNVTADELLGIDREKEEAEIKRINAEANLLLDRAHKAKAEKMLLDAHKRFPNSYELMVSLMFLYYNLSYVDGDGVEEKKKAEKNLHKCIAYAQRILEGCKDEESRDSANQILCLSYDRLGENEKAIEIARRMPTMSVCRESLLTIVSKDRAKLESRQTEIFMLLQGLCMSLDCCNVKFEDGTFAYNPTEEAALAQKIIDLLDVLFEEKDYGFFHDVLMRAHLHIARIFGSHEKDQEKTMLHLEAAADHAEAFLQHKEGKKHTSLFLRGSEYGTFRTSDENNNTAILLEVLKSDRFDFVREEERFKALTERLKKTAGQWK